MTRFSFFLLFDHDQVFPSGSALSSVRITQSPWKERTSVLAVVVDLCTHTVQTNSCIQVLMEAEDEPPEEVPSEEVYTRMKMTRILCFEGRELVICHVWSS